MNPNPNDPSHLPAIVKEDSFESIFQEARQSDSHWEALAIFNFTEAVLKRLDCLQLTKKSLADRMGVSPAYVTKLIGGQNNFTLRTMVKIARSLETELDFKLQPADSHSRWSTYSSTSTGFEKINAFPPKMELFGYSTSSPIALLSCPKHSNNDPIPLTA